MIVSLEAKSGPSAGKRVRLQSGQSLRVGRTAKSDFVVAEDSHLSGVHFAIELEENSCRIRDLDSRNGTLLNGQRITAGVLQDGDTITAGETTFRVTVEQAAVVAPASGPASDPKATPQQRLLALLRNDCQPLYAVLDTARDIKILALLTQSKEKHQSLYEGVQGAKLSQVAPYLVKLDKDSLMLGSLILEGWGNNWGVYLTCTSDFPELRRHLRHFLEVQLPDGKQVYFRFYDPRVLRVFLPTCTADEVNQFFGPVKHYLMEDEKPDKLVQFDNIGNGTDKKVFSLSQAAAGEDKGPPSSPAAPTTSWLEKATPEPSQ